MPNVNPLDCRANSGFSPLGVERRIDEAFYVDMFLAITNMEGIQPKNQLELMQRNEERLLQLGPVLERIHGEFLDGLIDRTFDQMVEGNLLPPAPPEIQGKRLKVNYISSLAQARLRLYAGIVKWACQFRRGLFGHPRIQEGAGRSLEKRPAKYWIFPGYGGFDVFIFFVARLVLWLVAVLGLDHRRQVFTSHTVRVYSTCVREVCPGLGEH